MEDNLLRPLISRKLQAEVLDLFLGTCHAVLNLDDRSGLLAQPAVRKSDDCHILDLIMLAQEIFDLYRIDVLASTDDDILLPVNKEIESILVLSCHISGEQPAVPDRLCGSFLISVITGHHARSLDTEFSDFALWHGHAVLVYNLTFPTIARHTDGSDLMDILHTQMHTARACRLGKTIVRIVLVMWEIFFPALDQRWRYRLCTDMHKPPLRKLIIL